MGGTWQRTELQETMFLGVGIREDDYPGNKEKHKEEKIMPELITAIYQPIIQQMDETIEKLERINDALREALLEDKEN